MLPSIAPLQTPPMFETAVGFGAIGKRMNSINRGVWIESPQNNLPTGSSVGAETQIAESAPNGPSFPYSLALLGLWIIGILAFIAFHLSAYVRFTSSVRRWGEDTQDERAISIMGAVMDELGLYEKQIAVKTCMLVPSPMLIGFFDSVILLPEKEISDDDLENIIRHELTHYKRKDIWVNLWIVIVSAIHWFNPFVHLMAKAVRTDCEMACDEAVVASNDVEWRKGYGETIIGFVGMSGAKTPTLSVLTTSFFGASKERMKRRLSVIMDTKKKDRRFAPLFIATVLLATVVLGNVFAVSAAPIQDMPQSPVQAGLPVHPPGQTRPIPQTPTPTNAPTQQPAIPTGVTQFIGDEQAKSIALSLFEFAESDVSNIRIQLKGQEKKTPYYCVKFNNGLIKYDVNVRASDGEIIEIEVVYRGAAQRPGDGSLMSEADARAIALSALGVTEADVTNMKAKLKDEGKASAYYKIEFHHGLIKYEYCLDAYA